MSDYEDLTEFLHFVSTDFLEEISLKVLGLHVRSTEIPLLPTGEPLAAAVCD